VLQNLRRDWLACVDRNCRFVVHPPLLHILEVMRRVMELAREGQSAFDASAFFGQPFQARFEWGISKVKHWEDQNLGTVWKYKRSIWTEKACIALRAERPLVNFELNVPQNSTEILKPV
jgi:hypothetical protein